MKSMNYNGTIILLQNVIFIDDKKTMIDSKYFHNRPCLVIGETDEELYVLPLSSNYSYQHQEYNFALSEKDIIPLVNQSFKKLSYLKIDNIFKKKICYYKICGQLKPKVFNNLLNTIKLNLETLKERELNGEIYQEYESYLNHQLQTIEKVQNEQIKKLKRRKYETKKRQRRK